MLKLYRNSLIICIKSLDVRPPQEYCMVFQVTEFRRRFSCGKRDSPHERRLLWQATLCSTSSALLLFGVKPHFDQNLFPCQEERIFLVLMKETYAEIDKFIIWSKV